MGFALIKTNIINLEETNLNGLSGFTLLSKIEINKAERLDSNRNFLSDIYNFVNEKDNLWSETIPNGEYVRVTFVKNLTSENDITLYARGDNSSVEVYEKK